MANLRLSRPAQLLLSQAFDLASVAANTTAEQSISVTGARPDMLFHVRCDSLPAGLIIANAHCETAGAIILTMGNFTGSPINPGSLTFEIVAF